MPNLLQLAQAQVHSHLSICVLAFQVLARPPWIGWRVAMR